MAAFLKSLTEAAQKIKGAAQHQSADIPSGYYVEDGVTTVSSLDGLQQWLESLGNNVPDSAFEMIRSLLQILSVVNSPVMVGMSFDRIIDSLNKSLRSAQSEEEKLLIRDAYASMIQNLFFFFEAKIRYAIDKNKDEAYQLLGQAGEGLSNCARTIAKSALSESAVKSLSIKDLMNTMPEQSVFFGKMVSWMKDKSEINRKMDDYRKTVQNVFQMFDVYSELIGPSVLIHGMLSKYRRFLVDIRKEERFAPVRKRYNTIAAGKSIKVIGKAFEADSAGSIVTNPIGYAIKSASKAVQGIGDVLLGRAEGCVADMDTFFLRLDRLNAEKEKSEQELQCILSELEGLQKEYDGLKLLQVSLKKESKSRIDRKNEMLTECKSKISDIEKQLLNLENSFPEASSVKAEIESYDADLMRIESKYILKP